MEAFSSKKLNLMRELQLCTPNQSINRCFIKNGHILAQKGATNIWLFVWWELSSIVSRRLWVIRLMQAMAGT
jgi:hypothetical protein